MSAIEAFVGNIHPGQNDHVPLGDAPGRDNCDFAYWQQVFDQVKTAPLSRPGDQPATSSTLELQVSGQRPGAWRADGGATCDAVADIRPAAADQHGLMHCATQDPQDMASPPLGTMALSAPSSTQRPGRAMPRSLDLAFDEGHKAEPSRNLHTQTTTSSPTPLQTHLYLNAQGQWQVTVRTTARQDDREVINAVAEALSQQGPQGAPIESIVHNGRQIYQTPRPSTNAEGTTEFAA